VLQLTTDNYYSVEASREYMTVSQLHAFSDCPEFAYRRYIVGDVKDEAYKPFVMGNFSHTWWDGPDAHAAFIQQHPEVFSSRGPTKGQLKSDYTAAIKALEEAKRDTKFMEYMTGEHEVIFTAELFGVPWAIRVDVINHEKERMSDFKHVASLTSEHWMCLKYDLQGNILPPDAKGVEVYEKNTKVPFYEAYHYWQRFAVYFAVLQKATGRFYELYMPTLTKEDPPNRQVFAFNNRFRLMQELDMVQRKLPDIIEHRGGRNLWKCGKCFHCRKNVVVEDVVEATSIY
jgi:hypothetical protein